MWVIEKHATADFETRSQAGYEENDKGVWAGLDGRKKKGLEAVGTLVYAEHFSTEVLCFSYMLPGDNGPTRWRPGEPNPQRLFDWLAAGGAIEFHNAMFERAIWHYQCRGRYGWPVLPTKQIRCSMAKARVNCLPGSLDNLTKVLPVSVAKNPDGKRLINKFSVPQKTTKKQTKVWIEPADDPEDAERLYAYCDTDVLAEEEVSRLLFPMSTAELQFWHLDQEINWRGIRIDGESVANMIAVLEEVFTHYGEEHAALTSGLSSTQVGAVKEWLGAKGVVLPSMDADDVKDALKRKDLPWDARRVLEIRQLTGSAAVKKLYAMGHMVNTDGRIRNIIIHHGARTGRPTGDLLQPLNLVKNGPDLCICDACGKTSKFPPVLCPWCGVRMSPLTKKRKWEDVGVIAVDHIQEVMATRSLAAVEHFYGDAMLAISGCSRGMLMADDGMEFIASDYTAIEAVVTAALAGCAWRLEVFRTPGEDIYLQSAAKATHTDISVYKQYAIDNPGPPPQKHPDRNKIGKYAELACGFGGWVGGWRGFDTSDNLTDEQVKTLILAWRAASPEIVELWGGQTRRDGYKKRPERYGFEGAFINAIQYPTQSFEYAGVQFYMRGDAVIIRLLSGRELTYQSPRLHPATKEWAADWELSITYLTWNSNPKYGPQGWVAMNTYGGKLAENIIQATAHDIQRFGILALEAAGYPIVLHVYDENIAEVPIGHGSIEEFEAIMSTMPPWAADWPIAASGGWRGKRYRKG